MNRKRVLFVVTGVGLALAGCQTTDWGKVAAGTGIILSGTAAGAPADAAEVKAAAQIDRYCPILQIAAAVATENLSAKARAAALQASAALNTICYSKPADVTAGLIVAERAVEAAKAARIVPPS